jgi:hypothetical protein
MKAKGLINNISSRLGFGGIRPNFKGETKLSTLHNQSSTIGNPHIIKNPSILDEQDVTNNNLYKSNKGRRYLDNLPK